MTNANAQRAPIGQIAAWWRQAMEPVYGGALNYAGNPRHFIVFAEDAEQTAALLPASVGGWSLVVTGPMTWPEVRAWRQTGVAPPQWEVPATGTAITIEELTDSLGGPALG